MNGTTSYRRRAFWLPVLAAAYLAVALQPGPYEKGGERFPFFSWSLFTYTSNERIDAVALVHAVNGVELETPQNLYDLPEHFDTAARRDPLLMKIVDRMANAIAKGDEDTQASARALIEEHYMKDARDVEYSIAVLRFDPVERYRSRKVDAVHELERYTKP